MNLRRKKELFRVEINTKPSVGAFKAMKKKIDVFHRKVLSRLWVNQKIVYLHIKRLMKK